MSRMRFGQFAMACVSTDRGLTCTPPRDSHGRRAIPEPQHDQRPGASCARAVWETYVDACLLSGYETASGPFPKPPISPLGSSATIMGSSATIISVRATARWRVRRPRRANRASHWNDQKYCIDLRTRAHIFALRRLPYAYVSYA